jgi:hypothetical protein
MPGQRTGKFPTQRLEQPGSPLIDLPMAGQKIA